MNKFYRDFLSDAERLRVERLEPFDEYEEFNLKCSHYFLLLATRGSCCAIAQKMNAVAMGNAVISQDGVLTNTAKNELCAERRQYAAGDPDCPEQAAHQPVSRDKCQHSNRSDPSAPVVSLTTLNSPHRDSQLENEAGACDVKNSIRVFGHAICALDCGSVAVIGGFGRLRRHVR